MKFTELNRFKPQVNKKNPIDCEKLPKVIQYYITKFNIIFAGENLSMCDLVKFSLKLLYLNEDMVSFLNYSSFILPFYSLFENILCKDKCE